MRLSAPVLTTILALTLTGLTGCGAETDPAADPAPTPTATAPTPTAPASTPGGSPEPSPAPTSAGKVPTTLAFTGTTLDGKAFNGADLAGKPVLLWFWAPWCPICAGQAPDVNEINSTYAGRVSVVGVAGLDDLPKMKPFVDRTKTGGFTHLGDPDGGIWRRFGITEQSTYVLIDAAGKVLFTGKVGGDELKAKVATLAG